MEETLNARLARHRSGLRLLYGPQKAEQYKNIGYGQAEAIVKGLAGLAEYIIVDLPACPSEANQAALLQCDFICLVLEPGPSGLKAGKIMLDLLNFWGVNRGIVGVVVANHRSFQLDLTDIKTQLGCDIVGVVPPAAEACWAAQAQGMPVVNVHPDSLITTRLNEIAGRLSTEISAMMQIENRSRARPVAMASL
jgi:Flp pilus assembly CpaE family ATPase